MKYEGKKHMGQINCTFGAWGLKPIVRVQIQEVVMDKEEKHTGVVKPENTGVETKCKITRRMFHCQH